MRIYVLILFTFILGCTSATLETLELETVNQTKIDQIEEVAANEFAATCLTTSGNVGLLREKLPKHGWQVADAKQLKRAKLSKLQKRVLEIPGGGGRFRETQSIYWKKAGENLLILNLEEQFSRDQATTNKCEIYANDELLPNCASIGKTLNRAPDRNQTYKNQEAHLISWSFKSGESASEITCKKFPKSRLIEFDGITLSFSLSKF